MEVKKPEPGYEWLLPDRVAKYLNEQEGPDLRAEIAAAHGRMIELLGLPPDAAFRFLDLGAGAGAVSASLMSRFPHATGLLADMSAAMMERGESMLEPYAGRYRYVEYDMNLDAWPVELAGPFEAVVSARAIHHLTAVRKAALFARVRDALATGGVFINWDNMRDASEVKITNRTTVPEYLELLTGAGFVSTRAEPEGHRAILLGRKSAD
jgi:cyclopropane fatty-acyl-phospholipid synthase-like methyltransferase